MFRALIQRTNRAAASKMAQRPSPQLFSTPQSSFKNSGFSTKTRKTAFYTTTAAAAAAAVCPIDHKKYVIQADANYVAQAEASAEALRKSIEALLEDDNGYDGYGHYGPVFIRLAWHASGTYDQSKKNGGSNGGCIRFPPESQHGANAGLDIARNRLEVIKQQFPHISYADIFTFAGAVATDAMLGNDTRMPFRFGRADFQPKVFEVETVRLPDATQGADHVRQVFTKQMGFNDQEIVALLGAHAVGKMHGDRSGFCSSTTGEPLPWTYAPTVLGNHYYTTLLEEKWTPVKNKFNNDVVQYENEKKDLIMLPAEMTLLSDPKFRPWVEKYAKNEEAWKKDYTAAFAKLLELGVPFPQ